MNHSETIGKLATALVKAQTAMTSAKKDAANPFFKSKYADLGSVVEAIKKPLNDNGLSYVQTTDIDETGSVVVETVLLHESGEWLSGRLKMPVAKANDPQALGSAMTYCRRYGLQAIAGVPAEDDDGNKAAGRDAKQDKKVNSPAADPAIKKLLEDCASLSSLAKLWDGLTKEQREVHVDIKEACKQRILKADEATQA